MPTIEIPDELAKELAGWGFGPDEKGTTRVTTKGRQLIYRDRDDEFDYTLAASTYTENELAGSHRPFLAVALDVLRLAGGQAPTEGAEHG